MTDNPGTRIETELDRIRREAFEKEARLLKEAALAHFKQQTSAELNGLRSALKEEVRTSVAAAMSDEAVKRALSKELTDQVLGKVTADIAKQIGDRIEREIGQAETRVIEKVRKDLLESWTKAARKALYDGLNSARADLARDQGGRSWLSLPRSRAEAGSGQAEVAEGRSLQAVAPADSTPASDFTQALPAPQKKEAQKSREPPKSRKSLSVRLLADDKLIAMVLAAVFFLAVYMIWMMLKSAPRRVPSTGASMPKVTQTETPAPPPALLVAAQRLRIDWLEVVTVAEDQLVPDSPLRRLLAEHPFNDQFSCWFSDQAQKELEALARGSSSKDLQQQLEDVFAPCFTKKPWLRDPMLAIFSAQATVGKTFSRYDWDPWCAVATNEDRPPDNLVADGVAGRTTQESMNLFLACTGHRAELRIEASSTTPHYLYVTYLALRELQRG